MAQASVVGPGLWFPSYPLYLASGTGLVGLTAATTLNAAGLKLAMMGFPLIDGRPAAAKTLSTSGGKIHFRVGTVTWGTAGTTLRVGIQDLSTGAGPTCRPDDSWDVYGEWVQGTNALASNSWVTVPMTNGTKNLTHGVTQFAVVIDMTVRNGSDSVVVSGLGTASTLGGLPSSNSHNGSAWSSTALASFPIALIEFDDGTLAVIDQTIPFSDITNETAFSDSTNPDERGLVFQVPWPCKIDALMVSVRGGATADFDLKLYSDPLGTPSAMKSISLVAEQAMGSNNTTIRPDVIPLGEEISLAANTNYCVAVKATGAGAIILEKFTLADANYRKFLSGGTTLAKATRNDSTGAFSTTTTDIIVAAVRISSFDDGAGGAGAVVPMTRR